MCLLCNTEQTVDVGEHVLPNWFLNRYFGPEEGPFTTFRGESPELGRLGKVRTQTSLPRVFLDVCRTCNGRMNQSFEQPLRPSVEQFYDGAVVQDAEHLCRWLVKTAVLHNHPELTKHAPGGERVYPNSRIRSVDQCLIDWIISDVSTPILDWVSIWVARSPRTSQKRLEPEIQKIDLPGYEFEGSSYQPLCSRLHVEVLQT